MEFIAGILFGIAVGLLFGAGLKLNPTDKSIQWLIWGSVLASIILMGIFAS